VGELSMMQFPPGPAGRIRPENLGLVGTAVFDPLWTLWSPVSVGTDCGFGQCVSAPTGRRTAKTEPLLGSLVTVTSPPIMRASFRVMARPRPMPPKR
jgi:hypothetical protein